MIDPSPYQPPRGAITPAPPARYGEIQPFSYRGRLGRVRYIGYSVGLGLLINLLAVSWGGVWVTLSSGDEAGLFALGGSALLVALGVTLAVLLAIQRLHDFDASGWWSVLNLVPMANLVLYLVLLIMPGTQGANRFGDPPPPNTTGVILLALVVPIIAVIGILAAIAIPAYQDYTERAEREARLNAPSQPQ
jgi:uncharacterized membrane protein YhaH (DUF805 family)